MNNCKLRNLNTLSHGIHKRWPLREKNNYNRVCDYLQKIGFSIQDLNTELDLEPPLHPKDIIFFIVQADWIIEAVEQIFNSFNPEVLLNFQYPQENLIDKAKKYLRALRSFAIAHPLTTKRHPFYGFDGDLICVDIRTCDITIPLFPDEDFYHLSPHGLEKKRYPKEDFYLYAYSEKADGMQFFQLIGCSINDICCVVELYVDKLYALARYLNKQRKKDYSEAL